MANKIGRKYSVNVLYNSPQNFYFADFVSKAFPEINSGSGYVTFSNNFIVFKNDVAEQVLEHKIQVEGNTMPRAPYVPYSAGTPL